MTKYLVIPPSHRFLASSPLRGDLVGKLMASLIPIQAADQAAEDEKGWAYDIVIMKFGSFQNAAGERGSNYVFPKEAAEKSLAVFEGAKVYSNSEGDRGGHKSDPNSKVPKDIIGVITGVRVTETELVGKLNLYRGTGEPIRKNLMGALADHLPIPYELSVDAYGECDETFDGTTKLVTATSYVRVSVDLVERGAAGGQIVRMAASHIIKKGDVAMTPRRKGILWLFSLLFPLYLDEKNVDYLKVDENELFTHLLEADKAQPHMKLPDGIQLSDQLINDQVKRFRDAALKTEDDGLKTHLAKLDKLLDASNIAPIQQPAPAQQQPAQAAKVAITDDPAFKAMQTQLAEVEKRFRTNLLSTKLSESKLPVPLQDLVREFFTEPNGALRQFQEAELDRFIASTRMNAGKLNGGKGVDAMGLDVRPGKDEMEKIQLGLDGFFLKNSLKPLTAQESKDLLQGVTPMKSIKQAYVLVTGDEDVTGLKKHSRRFVESLITTDWGEVVASAMNKALVRDYNMIDLQQWRNLADVVPLTDFKTQRRIRIGGYGNLPIVGQRGTYLPLASPTDEEATYVPAKRGGTEDLTLEMIKNDDVGGTQKIPQKLARSAIQTLHEFVMDMVIPSGNTESVGSPPNIFDGTPLYTSAHGNKFTAALAADAVALNAARLAMKKFANKDNSKRLGIRAGWLITPSDLEPINFGLTMPAAGNANLVPTFAQQLGLRPLTIDYWTDATDWVLAAKREDVTGVEVGFLDGREDPELFVSDVANSGSWFTNDAITYKIRHIYGGAVKDWRAFVGSVVSG